MTEKEMYKRLKEFEKYLDNMESSKEKGQLSKFFVGYMETYRQLEFEITKYKYHFE